MKRKLLHKIKGEIYMFKNKAKVVGQIVVMSVGKTLADDSLGKLSLGVGMVQGFRKRDFKSGVKAAATVAATFTAADVVRNVAANIELVIKAK